MANSIIRRRARLRRLPSPPGFGLAECERYQAKAAKVMMRVDALSPALRRLVHRYGAVPVLSKFAEGAREHDIARELQAESKAL